MALKVPFNKWGRMECAGVDKTDDSRAEMQLQNVNTHQTVKEYGKSVRKYFQLENKEQQKKIRKPLRSFGKNK